MNCLLIEIGCNIQLFNVIKAKILCITYGYRIFRELRVSHYPIFDYYLKMKTIFQLLIVLMIGSSYAQSNLPACKGSDVTRWDNCFGAFNWTNGNKYVGEWKDGEYNGQGTSTWTNGNKYVGEWKDGTRNGQGTFTQANGDKYVGEYKDGAPSGQGTETTANGNKYVGEWKDGDYNGQGSNTYANGDKYVGEFKDGKKNGHGTATIANGNKYVGEFKDGKRNGNGILYDSNGSVISQGVWKENEFNPSISAPIQLANTSSTELEKLQAEARLEKERQRELEQKLQTARLEKLRVEAELDKKRRLELEEQILLTQQQTPVIPVTQTTTMANRRALVIGNDTYTSVTKLNNAREDAKSIASNLISVGYQVTLKLDLNEKEMKAALRVFSSQVQGGDEVLFFFAGHGVQLGAANYLLPVDIGGESEAQVKDESIQLQRILDDMSDKKAKFTLAMIDACRDNPFKTAGRSIGGRGMAPTTAATGQMVVFSAGTGQQALDRLGNNDKDKNGVFTRTFLKEMQKSGISIDRIVKNVRNEVAELAKSVGHEQVPAIYDQVLGEFYFKK